MFDFKSSNRGRGLALGILAYMWISYIGAFGGHLFYSAFNAVVHLALFSAIYMITVRSIRDDMQNDLWVVMAVVNILGAMIGLNTIGDVVAAIEPMELINYFSLWLIPIAVQIMAILAAAAIALVIFVLYKIVKFFFNLIVDGDAREFYYGAKAVLSKIKLPSRATVKAKTPGTFKKLVTMAIVAVASLWDFLGYLVDESLHNIHSSKQESAEVQPEEEWERE